MFGGRVGDATPKANFWPAPTVAMCPSFAMRSRAAVTRRERERERYKLFESRVEAEGPREGSTRAAAVADEQDILSSKREKDFGGCERASERASEGGWGPGAPRNIGIQKSRTCTRGQQRRRGRPPHLPTNASSCNTLQIGLPPLHSENKEEKEKRKDGKRSDR